jgi:hypothetical protein
MALEDDENGVVNNLSDSNKPNEIPPVENLITLDDEFSPNNSTDLNKTEEVVITKSVRNLKGETDSSEHEEVSGDLINLSPLEKRLLNTITKSVLRAKDRQFRSQLAGVIKLLILPRNTVFIFDWRKDEPIFLFLDKAETNKVIHVDCTIELSEKTLRGILDGDLNPQITALTEKIKISGSVSGYAGLALYFFNLLE